MKQLRKILLVNADDESRKSMVKEFAIYGKFDIFEATTGASAMERLEETIFSMIIMDVKLPDTDGSKFCRFMRRENINIPIILISGNDMTADDDTADQEVIRCLEDGADDHLFRPLGFPVLFAKIRAHLRFHERSIYAILAFGPFLLDTFRQIIVTRDNDRIYLTKNELSILKFLYWSDCPVSKGVLLQEVWGYNASMETHTLETHIYRLRRKIEDNPQQPDFLVKETDGYHLKF